MCSCDLLSNCSFVIFNHSQVSANWILFGVVICFQIVLSLSLITVSRGKVLVRFSVVICFQIVLSLSLITVRPL